MKLRLSFLLAGLVVFATTGCAHRDRSSSRIYAGESPSIHYTSREAAGGPLGGR